MSFSQGLHQDAKNASTTGLPRRSESVISSPVSVGSVKSGARVPTFAFVGDGTTTSGVAFRLETTRERTGRGFRGVLTMTGRPRRPLPTIIVQYRMREGLDTPAGLATIRVGDAAFDDAFVVHASREDEAKTLLTPALRELLLGDPSSAVLRAEMLRVSEAEVALSYPAVAPGLYEPSRLESIARQVLALCG